MTIIQRLYVAIYFQFSTITYRFQTLLISLSVLFINARCHIQFYLCWRGGGG